MLKNKLLLVCCGITIFNFLILGASDRDQNPGDGDRNPERAEQVVCCKRKPILITIVIVLAGLIVAQNWQDSQVLGHNPELEQPILIESDSCASTFDSIASMSKITHISTVSRSGRADLIKSFIPMPGPTARPYTTTPKPYKPTAPKPTGRPLKTAHR